MDNRAFDPMQMQMHYRTYSVQVLDLCFWRSMKGEASQSGVGDEVGSIGSTDNTLYASVKMRPIDFPETTGLSIVMR
jgi:hypothetical protein